MVKNKVFPVIASLALLISIIGGFRSTSVVKNPSSDANPSVLGSFLETVKITLGKGANIVASPGDGGLIFTGLRSSVLTASTYTMPVNDIVGFNTVSYVANVPGVTITLPASTTFPQAFLPRPGDRTRILFLNATTTTGANSQIGFYPATGSLIQVASSTPAGTATTTGKTGATIDILRKPDRDLLFLITPFK